MIRLIAAMLLIVAPALANAQSTQQRLIWNRPFAPFQLYRNVYYVGTEGLSAFLITGPKGHVLIDGGLPESAPLIAANIRKLGFRLRDIHYLLINHAHYDHAGGLAALKSLTGAPLIAGAGDRADLEAGRNVSRTDLDGFPPVKVDRVVRDGDQVRVGPILLTAHDSAGHTQGAMSWTMMSGGKTILFASSLTVAGIKLFDNPLYPQAADDFRRTFARLRNLQPDIFLNFHPDLFNIQRKRSEQIAGKADAFVDRSELERQLDRAEREFGTELARQGSTARANGN